MKWYEIKVSGKKYIISVIATQRDRRRWSRREVSWRPGRGPRPRPRPLRHGGPVHSLAATRWRSTTMNNDKSTDNEPPPPCQQIPTWAFTCCFFHMQCNRLLARFTNQFVFPSATWFIPPLWMNVLLIHSVRLFYKSMIGTIPQKMPIEFSIGKEQNIPLLHYENIRHVFLSTYSAQGLLSFYLCPLVVQQRDTDNSSQYALSISNGKKYDLLIS